MDHSVVFLGLPKMKPEMIDMQMQSTGRNRTGFFLTLGGVSLGHPPRIEGGRSRGRGGGRKGGRTKKNESSKQSLVTHPPLSLPPPPGLEGLLTLKRSLKSKSHTGLEGWGERQFREN